MFAHCVLRVKSILSTGYEAFVESKKNEMKQLVHNVPKVFVISIVNRNN